MIEQNLTQAHGIDSDSANLLLHLDHQAILVLLSELACGADNLPAAGASETDASHNGEVVVREGEANVENRKSLRLTRVIAVGVVH